MATVIVGGIGAAIGGAVGGPAGARLGFSIGATLGGVLFPPKQPAQSRGRLDDAKLTGSQYGAMIPIVHGCHRVGCNIIDVSDLREVVTKKKAGGKGSRRQTTKSYTYFVDIACLVCEGPVGQIRRIWGEDTLLYDLSVTPALAPTNITTYTGTLTQAVDPTLQTLHGAGNTPAYRGRCYFTIDELDLTPWGGRIPAFTVEVCPLPPLVEQAILDGAEVVYIFNESSGNLINQVNPGTHDLSVDAQVIRSATGVVPSDLLAYDFSNTNPGGPLFGHCEGTRPSVNFANFTAEIVGRFPSPASPGRFALEARTGGGLTCFSFSQNTSGDLLAAIFSNVNNSQLIALQSLGESAPYAHYVWQRDGANLKHVGWRNAVQKYNVTIGGTTVLESGSTRNIAIGGIYQAGTGNINADVDFVAIYPNVLLTSEQIADHFAVTGI
jgi:hypothetical protein